MNTNMTVVSRETLATHKTVADAQLKDPTAKLERQAVNQRVSLVIDLLREAAFDAEKHSLHWTDRLSDLGVTSLRLIGLAVALEEQFELSAQALSSLHAQCTVGRLVQICLRTATAVNDPCTVV